MDNVAEIMGFLIGAISLGFAVYERSKRVKLQQIINRKINSIWTEVKSLSGNLLLEDESKITRKECGEKSQGIERMIHELILAKEDVSIEKIDEWKNGGLIDDYDAAHLKRLLRGD